MNDIQLEQLSHQLKQIKNELFTQTYHLCLPPNKTAYNQFKPYARLLKIIPFSSFPDDAKLQGDSTENVK